MLTSTAIVGYGVVGKAMHGLFPRSVIFDTAPGMPCDQAAVNACDVSFICVSTPPTLAGCADLSHVEDVMSWVRTGIVVLRSTVPPGTSAALGQRFGARIVFQPEYLGETPGHPFADIRSLPFVVLGGEKADVEEVAALYRGTLPPSVRYHFTDSTTAELAKYMANTYFATKVLFCNEFFDIAKALGVPYEELREVWLEDPRISGDHTRVYPENRGFGGRCLPKDLGAIIARAEEAGCPPRLLKAVQEINAQVRSGADRPPTALR